MALKPRSSVDDAYTDGLECAICTSTDLTVNHISEYPDFVSCGNCGSAFIVEDEGSWIMYGKIPAEYPDTSEFALRQWTWLDAVRQRAEDEREEGRPMPAAEAEDEREEGRPMPAAEAEVKLEMSSHPEPQVEDATEIPFEPAGTNVGEPEEPDPEPAPERPFVDEFQAFEEDEPAPEKIDEPLPTTPEPFAESPPAEEIFRDLAAFPEPPETEQEPTQLERDIFTENPIELPETPPEGSTIRELTEKDAMGLLMESPPNQSAAFERLSTTVDEQAAASAALKRETLEDQVQAEPEPEPELETSVPPGEPTEGKRFKVVVKGSELNFPKNVCAHCLRTPVVLGITVNGTLPDLKRVGARSALAFRLPLCEVDKKRAEARSEAEKSAVLQAHLISGVVAVFAVLIFLISGVVNPREELLLSGLMMILIAILGYGIPATILLGRANRYPPTHDSAYVLTTLRVLDDLGDLETAFEWRNQGYAELFRQVNHKMAVGDVETIADQVIIPDPELSEDPDLAEIPSAEDMLASEAMEIPEEQ